MNLALHHHKKRAVFLDRDGTIIVDKVYLNDPEQIEYLPQVFEGLRLLRDAQFKLIVVTNQSGIARGIVDIRNLHLIHQKIAADCAREGIYFSNFYYAPYSTSSNHKLRKPNPGMILEGARHFNIDLEHSWMVGDRVTDVEAGRKAGTRTILLEGEEKPDVAKKANSTFLAPSILSACQFIVRNS